jgi:hypothetical protein
MATVLTNRGKSGKSTKLFLFFFNCCFTVHFDKFKAFFLPTNALFIKT